MTKEELIDILRAELSISVEERTEFGPREVVYVALFLGNEEISKDCFDLSRGEQ